MEFYKNFTSLRDKIEAGTDLVITFTSVNFEKAFETVDWEVL